MIHKFKNLVFLVLVIQAIGVKSYSIDQTSLEVDLFPIITGGNYIGIGVAENGLKYRLIRAESSLPKFVLQDDIDSVDLEVYAFIVDYYFDKVGYNGAWIGAGVEYWKSKVTEKIEGSDRDIYQKIFTIGSGYIVKITEKLYINPWCAVHIDMSDKKKEEIGSVDYEIKKVVPEISLKIGYEF